MSTKWTRSIDNPIDGLLRSRQVLSVSAKSRLAGRQPPPQRGAPGDDLAALPAPQVRTLPAESTTRTAEVSHA